MNKLFKSTGVVMIIALMMFIVAACGGNNANNGASQSPSNSPSNSPSSSAPASTGQDKEDDKKTALSGQVIVDGSGTVYPLMATIADEYMANEQADVSVQVGRAGSSAGFKKFIPGELDFADASRAIKDEEKAELEGKGLKMGENVLEFKLAYDGLTMVINKDNNWATEMTKDEIVNMYLSGKFNADDKVKWSDIRAEWPADEIKFYGPNENHGTYEFFFENILKKEAMVKTAQLEQEYSTLVDLVSKDKNAIAFFGYGYYASNTDKLVAVKVDFGNGPVAPSAETIGEDLAYAGFTRPVFTYLNANYAKEKPQVLDYAYYVLEAAPKFAAETGFAPLPDAIYNEYKAQLDGLK